MKSQGVRGHQHARDEKHQVSHKAQPATRNGMQSSSRSCFYHKKPPVKIKAFRLSRNKHIQHSSDQLRSSDSKSQTSPRQGLANGGMYYKFLFHSFATRFDNRTEFKNGELGSDSGETSPSTSTRLTSQPMFPKRNSATADGCNPSLQDRKVL